MEKEKEKDNDVYVDIRCYIYIYIYIEIQIMYTQIYVCVDLSNDVKHVDGPSKQRSGEANIESDHLIKHFHNGGG